MAGLADLVVRYCTPRIDGAGLAVTKLEQAQAAVRSAKAYVEDGAIPHARGEIAQARQLYASPDRVDYDAGTRDVAGELRDAAIAARASDNREATRQLALADSSLANSIARTTRDARAINRAHAPVDVRAQQLRIGIPLGAVVGILGGLAHDDRA